MANENYRLGLQVETGNSAQNLNKVAESVNSVTRSAQKLQPSSAQASNALNNLSRIAQDAPFGFIGIQNNINPLLESFQRLKAETGSTSAALKSMVAGLAGPAGLGLAVGVASSLLVVFSKDIAEFFRNATNASDAVDDLKKQTEDYTKSVAKESSQLKVLKTTIENVNAPMSARLNAIKELRDLYPNIFKDYTNEELLVGKVGNAYSKLSDAIIKAGKARAAQGAMEPKFARMLENELKIAEIRKKAEEDASKAKAVRQGGFEKGGTVVEFTQEEVVASIFKRARFEVEQIRKENDGLKQEIENLSGVVQDNVTEPFKDATKEVKKKKDAFDEILKSFNQQIQAARILRNEMVLTQDAFGEDIIKAYESAINSLATVGTPKAIAKIKELTIELYQLKQAYKDLEPAQIETQKRFEVRLRARVDTSSLTEAQRAMQDPSLRTPERINLPRVKADDTWLRTQQELFKENTKAAQQFANVMASQLTNGIMNAASAFAKGETDAQGFFNAIKGLVIEIGFLLAKMAILKAIQSSIFAGATGGATMIGGGGGMFGAGQFLGSILGMATGGVVTGPTLAMIGEGTESEAVLPLSQLENIISNNGGNNMQLSTRISGNDLVLLLNRTNNSLGFRR